MSGTPIAGDYIKAEGIAGRIGARLMAVVAEGDRGRVYLAPTSEHEATPRKAKPAWKPEGAFVEDARAFTPFIYGLGEWHKLFSDRQLVALTTFSELVGEAMLRIRIDAVAASLPDDPTPLRDGGTGATSYAESVGMYLAFALDKSAVYWNSLCPWLNQPKNEIVGNSFGRQAIPMVWDYAEANPFSDSGGNIDKQVDYVAKAIVLGSVASGVGFAIQADASAQSISQGKVVSTDPPYYDNVPYADLSDFFYIWLRRSLRSIFPDLFATLAVPKAEELVAFAYRHEQGKAGADAFFLTGMTRAMHNLRTPVTRSERPSRR